MISKDERQSGERGSECEACPRSCRADRAAGAGYCRSGSGFEIASICLHRGEEPAISGERGICNIFFSHCNLQCAYCQNFQISRNDSVVRGMSLDEAVGAAAAFLDEGAASVGFVSPSHMIPQMRSIVEALRGRSYRPTVVMNTNAYDRAGTIASLEDIVDVYLPDFKYMDHSLALELSGAWNYPEVALAALREMHRQKGSNLGLRDDGTASSGLIVRHLILPGQVENSKAVLRAIAEELSPSVHISLMSQYYPAPEVARHPWLGRSITRGEYDEVLDELERLGFHRGWVQELESQETYRPDFTKPHPFE
ncbi:MAG: radical SAM protein [Candidatus Krumholzibacteriia bacterium]